MSGKVGLLPPLQSCGNNQSETAAAAVPHTQTPPLSDSGLLTRCLSAQDWLYQWWQL